MANSTKVMLEAMNNLAVAIPNAKSAMELNSNTILDHQEELDVPALKFESEPIPSPSMGKTLQNCLNSNKKLEHVIK